jgi:hypothetical protein
VVAEAVTETGQVSCDGCEPGTFLNGNICSACPGGKFSSDYDTDACTACPSGFHGQPHDRSSCSACPPGMWGDKKLPNLGGAPDISAGCLKCSAGRYSIIEALTANSSLIEPPCLACPKGRWSGIVGSSALADCESCSAGQYLESVGAVSKDDCVACNPGLFSETAAAQNVSVCKACPAGFFQLNSSRAFCFPCSPGRVQPSEKSSSCTKCPLGKFQEHSAKQICQECPRGKYQNDAGRNGCIDCGGGQYSSSTGQQHCVSCRAGFYRSESSELSETVTENENSTTLASSCVKCDLGSDSEDGAKSCTECDLGLYGKVRGACESCPTGWYANKKGLVACTECKIGEQFDGTRSFCSKCALGKFGKARGLCEFCQQGQYADARGLSECLACPSSRYSSKEGATSQAECAPCPADRTTGNKTGVSDFSECLCLDGSKYQRDDMDVVCADCPEGAVCPVKGSRISDLYAQNSYWQATNNTHKFYDCGMAFSDKKKAAAARENCCPEDAGCDKVPRPSDWTTDRQCAVGYSGPLCVACAENFLLIYSECIACDGGSPLWVGIAGLCGVGFVLFLVALVILNTTKPHSETLVETKQERISGLITIIVSWLQILSAFTVTYSVAWPKSFATFSQGSGTLVNLEIISVLAISNCQLSVPFLNKFLLQIATPPVSLKYSFVMHDLSLSLSLSLSHTHTHTLSLCLSISIYLYLYLSIFSLPLPLSISGRYSWPLC